MHDKGVVPLETYSAVRADIRRLSRVDALVSGQGVCVLKSLVKPWMVAGGIPFANGSLHRVRRWWIWRCCRNCWSSLFHGVQVVANVGGLPFDRTSGRPPSNLNAGAPTSCLLAEASAIPVATEVPPPPTAFVCPSAGRKFSQLLSKEHAINYDFFASNHSEEAPQDPKTRARLHAGAHRCERLARRGLSQGCCSRLLAGEQR